jgi:hypothetical protein
MRFIVGFLRVSYYMMLNVYHMIMTARHCCVDRMCQNFGILGYELLRFSVQQKQGNSLSIFRVETPLKGRQLLDQRQIHK